MDAATATAGISDLVVVDASVLLAIALPDPQANKDYASALLFAIDKGDVTPVLTQLCCQEVAAKLVCKVRGVVITAVKARAFFDLLSDVEFQHVVDVRDFESLFADAIALGCGSYDAAYLRAALDNGAPLATPDKKLMPHLRSNKVQRSERESPSNRARCALQSFNHDDNLPDRRRASSLLGSGRQLSPVAA